MTWDNVKDLELLLGYFLLTKHKNHTVTKIVLPPHSKYPLAKGYLHWGVPTLAGGGGVPTPLAGR